MEKRRIIGFISIIIGVVFLLDSRITGAVISASIGTSISFIIGMILLIGGIGLMLVEGRSLESRLGLKRTLLQRRQGELKIINQETGENYTLDEVKDLVKEDPYYKKELKKMFSSDLKKLYTKNPKDWRPKSFLRALFQNLKKERLDAHLKEFYKFLMNGEKVLEKRFMLDLKMKSIQHNGQKQINLI